MRMIKELLDLLFELYIYLTILGALCYFLGFGSGWVSGRKYLLKKVRMLGKLEDKDIARLED